MTKTQIDIEDELGWAKDLVIAYHYAATNKEIDGLVHKGEILYSINREIVLKIESCLESLRALRND